MPEAIHAFFQENKSQILDDLAALVAVPSVVTRSTPGHPYGDAPYAVMEKARAIARRMGLETSVYGQCCLTAQYPGKPAKLCLLAHLDVVDAGDGWTKPPYALTVDGNTLYGRGVADDKGPAIAILYAMKAAQLLRPDLPFAAQAWFGTAEEIGSPDLKDYMRRHRLPPVSLTPDALEPIAYGEKGKYRPVFRRSWEDHTCVPRVEYLQGGKVRNAIPGYADALVLGMSGKELAPYLDACSHAAQVSFSTENTADGCRIFAVGRGTHIGTPQLGRNAQTALLALLSALPLAECDSTDCIRRLAALFPHGDMSAQALGVSLSGTVTPLSVNFTKCVITPNGFEGTLDSRTPPEASTENFSSVIEHTLRENGFCVDHCPLEDAHYVSPEAPLVRTVAALYETAYGKAPSLHFSTGASYAHYIPGAVSTGAASEGIDTMLHKSDEFLPLDDLERMITLYTLAVIALCEK